MSIWRDIHRRSNGLSVRKEDIHKCTAVVEKCGGAQRIGGFYTLYKEHIKLNEEQKQSLRWHEYRICLKDERFNRWRRYKVAVITPLGSTGESIVKDAISKVEKKYGYFDGYTCEEVNTEMHKYVTEKNLQMIKEIREDLNLQKIKMLGWKECIVHKKAISAELNQNIYYNSDDSKASFFDKEWKEQTGEIRLLPSGKYREKEIGNYMVTYEKTWKNSKGEYKSKVLQDNHFLAIIGTDVVAAWQKLNDEYVAKNREWFYIINSEGQNVKAYKEKQFEDYFELCYEYKEKLFEEYGCKVECE